MLENKKLRNGIKASFIDAKSAETGRTLWVSTGEYNIYDNYEYDYMEGDKVTGKQYEETLQEIVENKKVLDIGTGALMDWALESVDGGAKEVVALEGMKESYKKAKRDLDKWEEYKEKIKLLNLWSYHYEGERDFDIIVSEIIGNIGGAEGAEVALSDALNRFLKDDGVMVPLSCQTLAAGVCIHELIPHLGFHPECKWYLDEIFKENGAPFDLRLMIYRCEESDLLTTEGVVENLNFNNKSVLDETSTKTTLNVIKKGKIDGLLLWINLIVSEGKEINSLKEHTAWEHIYIPLFNSPVEVNVGDKLEIECIRSLSFDLTHPDYTFKAKLFKGDEVIFAEFTSFYKSDTAFGTHPIYKKLFNI